MPSSLLPRAFLFPASTSPSLRLSASDLVRTLTSASSESVAMDTSGERLAKETDDAEAAAKLLHGGGDKTPPPPPPRGISEIIMPHLLNIYGSCATARDFEIYAPSATFEDPLMRAHGVKQIKSAFYTLPKIFGESRIVEYTIQENIVGPGKVEILIDNKQHYKFLGKAVDLTTLIRLNVEEGKVVRHEDWWDKKPLKNRHTVGIPLVGRIAEVTRRGAMLLTHAIMGFGKDPTP